jgi:threonine aldolase
VQFCFSKGLGAPVGSILVASAEAITRGRALRKLLGGGMRQAGVIAAAALYALEHQMTRLADDHARARALATALSEWPRITIDLDSVQSNIVLVRAARAEGAEAIVRDLRAAGVLCGAYDRRTVRFVTHLDFGDDDLEAARKVFARVLT